MDDFAVGFLGDCSFVIITLYYDDVPIAVTEFREHSDEIGVLEHNIIPLSNEIISSMLVS